VQSPLLLLRDTVYLSTAQPHTSASATYYLSILHLLNRYCEALLVAVSMCLSKFPDSLIPRRLQPQ
jgi:hypothetical protein